MEKLESELPPKFPGKKPLPPEFRNGVREWHIHTSTPGLFTMDIEHIPPEAIELHNDPSSGQSVGSIYNKSLCVHKCPTCFNKQSTVYRKNCGGKANPMLTLEETLSVVDQAIEIASKEGHRFHSVKFLGPGELLMNPDLFKIIEEYRKRGIILSIFTKGALLGSDELAVKHQNHAGIKSAKDLVDKLAACENVNLLFSFQSFSDELQEEMVGGTPENYIVMRNRALGHVLSSAFYKEGITDRICMINAPLMPENIDESLGLYRFFMEHGTPMVMTPTMLSGKGGDCFKSEEFSSQLEDFRSKLVELYSEVYLYNVLKGIQTLEQIQLEGTTSYVGAEPCNQASLGLYLRANGIVQMCPGRFDRETVFANVRDVPLAEIWERSPNRQRGMEDPHNLLNNCCPAKDSTCPEKDSKRIFFFGFYERVMEALMQKLRAHGIVE
jgi:MoaA/NifB/PqqE/SkfB family radical SAM enzyme